MMVTEKKSTLCMYLQLFSSLLRMPDI